MKKFKIKPEIDPPYSVYITLYTLQIENTVVQQAADRALSFVFLLFRIKDPGGCALNSTYLGIYSLVQPNPVPWLQWLVLPTPVP